MVIIRAKMEGAVDARRVISEEAENSISSAWARAWKEKESQAQ